MKAIIYTQYGPPEVAQVATLAKPVPGKKDLLVKVHAATVNRTDAGFRSAAYFVSRFWSGLLKPKYQILGCEFAGRVEACGEEVKDFKPGDDVFGYNDETFGCHAEYLVINEDKALGTMPKGFSYVEAAPLTEGAHYALCNIRAAKVEAGQCVLVNGASGGIGSAAVQLLLHIGAQVTAVCGTKNVGLIKSLGAHKVVDYQTQDFTKTNERYHLVFDAVGKSSFGACKTLLMPDGKFVSTELGKNGDNVWRALFAPILGKKRVIFPMPSISKADVIFLKSLAESGAYKPIIDRTYQMEEIVAAYHYVESEQKTGNVVLMITE